MGLEGYVWAMAVGARANAMKLMNPETKIRRLDLEVERLESPAVVCPLFRGKGEMTITQSTDLQHHQRDKPVRGDRSAKGLLSKSAGPSCSSVEQL